MAQLKGLKDIVKEALGMFKTALQSGKASLEELEAVPCIEEVQGGEGDANKGEGGA